MNQQNQKLPDVSKLKLEVSHFETISLENPLTWRDFKVDLFRIGFEMKLVPSKRPDRVGVSLKVNILPDQDAFAEKKTPQAAFQLFFGFYFPDLPEFVKSNESQKTQQMEPHLQITLYSLAYSTARGMIIGQTRGTLYESASLPIVPPKELLRPVPAE